MLTKIYWVLFLMTIFANCAWAQTAADISAKYPVVNAYDVHPGILMIAKYANDGQVCEITLEKRRERSGRIIIDSSTISREIILQLIDELVPVAERGKPMKEYPLNMMFETFESGNLELTEAEFEKVHIAIAGSRSKNIFGDVFVWITWKQRTCAAPPVLPTVKSHIP
jgi:hypothetical protein